MRRSFTPSRLSRMLPTAFVRCKNYRFQSSFRSAIGSLPFSYAHHKTSRPWARLNSSPIDQKTIHTVPHPTLFVWHR